MLITDRTASARPLVDVVSAALRGGVTAVMLREKDLPHDALVALGRPTLRACRAAGALFLVNHDVAAALELGADGVHLGFRSPPPEKARAMAVHAGADDLLVGVSTHDAAEVRRALDGGADYVTFGPIYDTPKKRGLLEPRGVDALAHACRAAAPAPVVALGGVTSARVPELRRAGAAGVAIIGGVAAADDPEQAARDLRAAWEAAR